MTKEEFALKIKEKYPAYKDQDNDILVGKVLQKYPEYSSQVDQQPSTLGMAGQALGQTLSQDLPAIGGAVGQMRQGITPGLSAVQGMMPNNPIAQGAMAGAGMALAPQMALQGNALPKTGLDLALNAAGPLLEAGAAGIRGGVRAGRAIIPSIVSALTREEAPIVERWINRSTQVAKKLKTPLDADATEQLATKLKDAVKEARSAVGRMLGKVEDAVASRSTKMIPTADIGNQLAKDLANAGYDVKGYTGAEVTKKLNSKTAEIIDDFKNLAKTSKERSTVGPLMGGQPASGMDPMAGSGAPFSPSPEMPGYRPTLNQNVTNPLYGSGAPISQVDKPMSFKGVLNLRRKIDQAVEFRQQASMGVDSVEEAILKKHRSALNQRLLQSEPAFAAGNNHFAKVAQVYDQLKNDVLSGKAETVANRMARIFKKGTIERKVVEKMDTMGTEAAGQLEDLLDTIAGQRAKPRINPAIGRAAMATGGGLAGEAARLAGTHSPQALASAVGGLATAATATSPRANFRVLQAAKEIGKALSKIGLGPTSQLAASLSAPAIHDAILNHAMDQHLQNASSTP